MAKDLTTSEIDRQNILNNPYALADSVRAILCGLDDDEELKLKILHAISADCP